MLDDDDEVDKYELVDVLFIVVGLYWYEVSNWVMLDVICCCYNIGYWVGGDWWGVGLGVYSYVGGVWWWNVKYLSVYVVWIVVGYSFV